MVLGDYATAAPATFAGLTQQGQPTTDFSFTFDRTQWISDAYAPGYASSLAGRMHIAIGSAADGGRYQYQVTYRGLVFTPPNELIPVEAVDGYMTPVNALQGAVIAEKDHQNRPTTLVLPVQAFTELPPVNGVSPISPLTPDLTLTDTWRIRSRTISEDLLFAPPGEDHLISIAPQAAQASETFVQFSLNTERTRLSVSPNATLPAGQRGGDGAVVRTASEGRYYVDGVAYASVVPTTSGNPPTYYALPGSSLGGNSQFWITGRALGVDVDHLSGQLTPLTVIVPDLDIVTPTGDPTAAQPSDNNEWVFDLPTRTNGVDGQLSAGTLPTLSAAARQTVAGLMRWSIDNVGSRQATLATPNALTTQVTYQGMPANHNDFGRKRITLELKSTGLTRWRWYQDVEMFFHARGSSASSVQGHENWFYYWGQIVAPQRAAGNSAISFSPIAGDMGIFEPIVTVNSSGMTSTSTIYMPFTGHIVNYIGLLAHEQQHENDFFNVIWQRNGYILAQDTDRNPDGTLELLRDQWEVDTYGSLDFDFDYAFETSKVHLLADAQNGGAWGDLRGDQAAIAAINAWLDVARLDWSDINSLMIGEQFRFQDKDGGKLVTSNPITAGSNKDF